MRHHSLLVVTLPASLRQRAGQWFAAPGQFSVEHPYADWLATYTSEDFDAVGAWLRARLDSYADDLQSGELARLREIFLLSTRYEWLFWEMAWQLEEWPS